MYGSSKNKENGNSNRQDLGLKSKWTVSFGLKPLA